MSKAPVVLQDQSTRLAGSKLYVVFLGLQLALFLSFLDSTSVATAIPIIGRDLNASESVTWVGTSFLVANTSFQIVTSRLSDVFGRKVVLLAALGVFVLGNLLCGFAQDAIWLYCCRALAGIGGGGINSLCMIIMSDVVSLQDRGKYQGFLGIAISLGSGVGPFMGALFAQRVSWRWIFWISPPLGALTMVIIWFLLPLTHVGGDLFTKVKKMDCLGTFLSLAMTVCFLVPLAGGGTTFAWNTPVVIALFVVSVVTGVAFALVQAFVARLPLLPLHLFTNYNISLILLQTWLLGMVFYGNIFYIPIYAQNVLTLGAIKSACILLPLVLSQTFTVTLSGLWVKRTGKTKSSFVFGFALWFAGTTAQLCFKRSTSIGVIVGVLLVQGGGSGRNPSEHIGTRTGFRSVGRSRRRHRSTKFRPHIRRRNRAGHLKHHTQQPLRQESSRHRLGRAQGPAPERVQPPSGHLGRRAERDPRRIHGGDPERVRVLRPCDGAVLPHRISDTRHLSQ